MSNTSTRLKRVIGQLNGIVKMMEEKQDCEKIIIQFQAAKAALDSAFAESLNTNLENCLTQKDSEKMKKIIKLISKK
jgi:DNA-binding FrmR family transcriptional regulator